MEDRKSCSHEARRADRRRVNEASWVAWVRLTDHGAARCKFARESLTSRGSLLFAVKLCSWSARRDDLSLASAASGLKRSQWRTTPRDPTSLCWRELETTGFKTEQSVREGKWLNSVSYDGFAEGSIFSKSQILEKYNFKVELLRGQLGIHLQK